MSIRRYLGAFGLVSCLGLSSSLMSFGIDAAAPGHLEIRLAVSPTPKFLKDWMQTSPATPVTIRRLHEMRRGEVAYIGFIVSGWVARENSTADLEIDCQILNPDGTALFTLPGYARYRGSAPQPAFVMADPALDLHIDLTDQLGSYSVKATVRDRVSGKSASDEYSLLVTKERRTTP